MREREREILNNTVHVYNIVTPYCYTSWDVCMLGG